MSRVFVYNGKLWLLCEVTLKLLEGNIEVHLNLVVPTHTDSFDELCDDPLLGLKCR